MKLSPTIVASLMAVMMMMMMMMATDTMAFVPSVAGNQHASTAFVTSLSSSSSSSSRLYSTMADAGIPPTKTSEGDAATSNADAEVTIPTNLPSDVGFDYVPLASCLATGQWAEADQVCVSLIFSKALLCSTFSPYFLPSCGGVYIIYRLHVMLSL